MKVGNLKGAPKVKGEYFNQPSKLDSLFVAAYALLSKHSYRPHSEVLKFREVGLKTSLKGLNGFFKIGKRPG